MPNQDVERIKADILMAHKCLQFNANFLIKLYNEIEEAERKNEETKMV